MDSAEPIGLGEFCRSRTEHVNSHARVAFVKNDLALGIKTGVNLVSVIIELLGVVLRENPVAAQGAEFPPAFQHGHASLRISPGWQCPSSLSKNNQKNRNIGRGPGTECSYIIFLGHFPYLDPVAGEKKKECQAALKGRENQAETTADSGLCLGKIC